MSKTLHNCGRLEIRESQIEGYGVFATEKINKGEVLEEVPFVLFPRWAGMGNAMYEYLKSIEWVSEREKYIENLRANLKFKEPDKYYFKWHPKHQIDEKPIVFTVLPLGNGPIYNSSNTNNNAGWTIQEKTFIFRAERDIEANEEIRTFYGYFLGQDGVVFPCDDVFNLAIDTEDGIHRVKQFRFGALSSYEEGKQNPTISRGFQLLKNAKNGLIITAISAIIQNDEERGKIDVPKNISLSQLYQKLLEYRKNAFSTKIYVEYEDKDSKKVTDSLVFFKK